MIFMFFTDRKSFKKADRIIKDITKSNEDFEYLYKMQTPFIDSCHIVTSFSDEHFEFTDASEWYKLFEKIGIYLKEIKNSIPFIEDILIESTYLEEHQNYADYKNLISIA